MGSALCQVGCFFLAPVLSTCRAGASLPQDIWDRSPTTRDRTCVPRIARWTFSFKIYLLLFPVVLHLCCCAQLAPWRKGGDFSCCGAQAVGLWASGIGTCGLYSAGFVVVCTVACGICLDPGLSPCTCFDRQILNHQLGSPKAVTLEVKSQSSCRAGSLLEMHIFRSHPGPADPSLKLSGVRPSHQL